MTIKTKFDPHQTLADAIEEARLYLEVLQGLPPETDALMAVLRRRGWLTFSIIRGKMRCSPLRKLPAGEPPPWWY